MSSEIEEQADVADRPNSGSGRDPLLIAAVVRAFKVAEHIADAPNPPTLGELAQDCGMTFQTAQRIANAMIDTGYLNRDERHKTYRFSQKTLDLQYTYLRTDNILKAAWPILLTLREQTKMRISLCVRDGSDIVYVLRLASDPKNFQTLLIGRRRPAALTAGGLAILSGLPPEDRSRIVHASDLRPVSSHSITAPTAILARLDQIAEDGFCIAEQEIRAGEISAAIPLATVGKLANYALVTAGSTETNSPVSMRQDIVPLLRNAAIALERA